jgi:hypothetical protein
VHDWPARTSNSAWISLYASLTPPKPSSGSRTTCGERDLTQRRSSCREHQQHASADLEAVGGTLARGGPSTPYGNLQEDTMSDQTDLIRGHPRLLTIPTIALEPRLSAGVDLVLERT